MIDKIADALKITPDRLFAATSKNQFDTAPSYDFSLLTVAESECTPYNSSGSAEKIPDKTLESLKEDIRKKVDESIERAFDRLDGK